MLSKSIRQRTETNAGEEVDGITGVSRNISGKHAAVPLALLGVGRLETISQFRHSHCFGHFLDQNLDKDTRGRRRFILVQVNDRQNRPGHRIRVKQMRKQLGHIPQLVGFQPMDRLVLHPKRLHKGIAPAGVEKTEAAGNHTVVSEEGPLLRAALDDHVD